jgi:hypothetical protein
LTVDLFKTAPLLREVTLIGLYTHELILPWPQLISFNGSKINRTALGQVVANSLDLERLEVTGYSYGAGPKTATLPRLTNLKVKLENPHISSNFFFGSLNLPRVEVIEVEEYKGDVVPHLMLMLSRCPTPSMLRKLSLRNVVPEAPGDLTSLLKLTPQLLELHIELPPVYDLCELIISTENPPLVPLLETLIIHASSSQDVWRKEIPATALARSRCEIDQGSFPLRTRLKTFRLIFPNPRLCCTAQAGLNGWLEDDPTKLKSSDQTRLLKLWRQVLHEELPELDYNPSPRKRKFDLKFSQRLDRLVGAIEDFKLDDIKGLYVSGLHSSLRRLSCIPPNNIPGENIYHFRMRSQEILNNWAPSLRKELDILQWVIEGTNSLIYIPLNDALRGSPEALNMVYGGLRHP